MVNRGSLAENFMQSQVAAYSLLVLAGLASPPEGSSWEQFEPQEDGMSYLWCTSGRLDSGRRCLKKASLAHFSPLLVHLPRVQTPVILDLIYSWSQVQSVNEAVHETGASESTVIATFKCLREAASDWVMQRSEHSRLGGPGVIVAVDETFITRKKRNKAGFGGVKCSMQKLL